MMARGRLSSTEPQAGFARLSNNVTGTAGVCCQEESSGRRPNRATETLPSANLIGSMQLSNGAITPRML